MPSHAYQRHILSIYIREPHEASLPKGKKGVEARKKGLRKSGPMLFKIEVFRRIEQEKWRSRTMRTASIVRPVQKEIKV